MNRKLLEGYSRNLAMIVAKKQNSGYGAEGNIAVYKQIYAVYPFLLEFSVTWMDSFCNLKKIKRFYKTIQENVHAI